jgi:uncharacterized protein
VGRDRQNKPENKPEPENLLNSSPTKRSWLRAFLPNERLASVLEITPDWLRARGLRGLILDLDNTLVAYRSELQTPELEAWAKTLRDAGVQARLVSNALPERIERWASRLGFPGVGLIGRGTAAKPFPAAFLRAARAMQLHPRFIAVVGDQLFTDVLGGNLIGAYTILVAPLSQNALPHTRLARALERAVLHSDNLDSSDLASKPSRR